MFYIIPLQLDDNFYDWSTLSGAVQTCLRLHLRHLNTASQRLVEWKQEKMMSLFTAITQGVCTQLLIESTGKRLIISNIFPHEDPLLESC